MQTQKELEKRFAIAGRLQFQTTQTGLVHAVITTAEAEAHIYLQGAHVTQWTPAGQKPVLFMSSRSEFAPGKAIRGGVPIIFPWFGPRAGGLAGPSHGFARTAPWRLIAANEAEGKTSLVFVLEPKDLADTFGYSKFRLQFNVAVGTELAMELRVRNEAAASLKYEDALHSYFAVGDIEQIAVSGLAGTTYLDKTDGMARKRSAEQAIRFANETDQLHLNTTASCAIEDAKWKRRVVVEKSGSESTVVWNPWAEKAKVLKDMGPDEWRSMVCVEPANAADNALTLEPGQVHLTRVVISLG